MVLVVYDTSGRVLYQVAGTYDPPSGIPYIEADIDPNENYVVRVDVEKDPHEPIIEKRENLYYNDENFEEESENIFLKEDNEEKYVNNDEVFSQLFLNQAKIMAMLINMEKE